MSVITFKKINKIAIPAIIAGIAEPILSITDAAIIGHISNDASNSFAAASIVGTVLSALIWIFAQTKSAISAIVSKYFGAKKLNELNTLIQQVLTTNLLIGMLVILLLFFNAIFIINLLKANSEVEFLAVNYLKIRSFGFPLTIITFTIFGVLRGLQNTSYAMWISIIGALLNILLDYIFVYGFAFIPEMGLNGAAIASLSAQFVMFILALILLIKKTPFRWRFKIESIHKEYHHILKLSVNLFIRTAALNFAMFLGQRFSTSYGVSYNNAYNIGMNIWLFSSFFIDGYANAGNAISGRLLGANDFIGLKKLVKNITKYSVIVSCILGSFYLITYTVLPTFFIDNFEVKEIFYTVFWIIIISQPINAIAFALDGVFKGLGEAVYLRNVLLLSTFLIFIPAIYIFNYLNLSLAGIWISFSLWMLARATFLSIGFKKYLNRHL